MYFTKFPHRSNFSFVDHYSESESTIEAGGRKFSVSVTTYEGDLAHVEVTHHDLWEGNKCLDSLTLPLPGTHKHLKVSGGFRLNILGKRGKALLKGTFGVSGEASMFAFELDDHASFFGMGEKSFGKLELSGIRTKFWNTDVWGDFHAAQWQNNPADPSYISIPYLVVKVGEEYVGLLLHNPYPSFIETPCYEKDSTLFDWQRPSSDLLLGTEGGQPSLWIIYGPTLKDLTRKLQKLIGVTPLPPAWSLGYHQSRWGYGGHDDLMMLDAKFSEYKIPCDSLWLDLDYMDGYRIFQTSKEMFPNGVTETVSKLAESSRRIVPILDPGVKFEPGYKVYDDGHHHKVFCQNAEGKEFVGLVWPGETVFPDFTVKTSRDWWSGYVKEFASSGFGASWLDMNDPSTGSVDPCGMRFNNGRQHHFAYHNQYALGMQMATRDGFLKARPNERPFLLSRSGFIGSGRFAAIWTGDNFSNYFHLSNSIPTSVNLSISGVPFNGADIGGFGGSVTDALMIDWVKAGFLFPFFRNHCARGERQQEPFAFPEPIMSVLRRYIRLRYKLFPYLYNLFVDQEDQGDPILRPVLYEFNDEGLEKLDDQFMVGANILQAPFVEDKAKTRSVVLPGNEPWYEATSGDWIEPGTVIVKNDRSSTPLYMRAGAIVPMQPGTPVDTHKDLLNVHFHVFLPHAWSGESSSTYRADDGISFGYQKGERTSLSLRLVCVNGNLVISVDETEAGFGSINGTFVIHGDPKSVRINGGVVKLSSARVVLTGKPLKVSIAGIV